MHSGSLSLNNISTAPHFNQPAQSQLPFDLFPSSQPLFGLFDFPEVQVPVAPQSFDDDMPLPQTEDHARRAPLTLQCIPGMKKNQQEGSFDGVVKLNTPESAHESASADFVVVADVSGSMREHEKIEQLKQTLHWLVDNLGNRHRMSLITFNDYANRLTPLTVMDTAGKAAQSAQIRGITANGGTNITSALDTAAQVLDQRRTQNQVAIVILVSDGQDQGALARSQNAITKIARKALLTCVGLGIDHDARLLSGLGESADGQFVFCSGADAIAPTMGGFVFSTRKAAATGVKLLVQVAGRTVSETRFPLITEGQQYFVPFTTTMAHNPYVTAHLTYTPVGSSDERSVEITGRLRTRSDQKATPDELLLINKHKNRQMASKVLRQATELAEQGNFVQARQILENAIRIIESSISRADPLCVELIADCRKSLDGLRNETAFNQGGAATALSAGLAHQSQSGMIGLSSYASPSASLGSQSASFSVNLASRRQ
jgi:uncharacterized protein YegL